MARKKRKNIGTKKKLRLWLRVEATNNETGISQRKLNPPPTKGNQQKKSYADIKLFHREQFRNNIPRKHYQWKDCRQ